MAAVNLSQCDVFVLAAGMGSRLKPLTDRIPKALVPVGGKPLIAWNLELLARAGCQRVIVNLFHLGVQIREFVGDGSQFGLEVVFVEETQLLDTGGSIKNIESLLRHQQLFTINSDILVGPEFSPSAVIDSHRSNPRAPLATMVLRSDPAVEEYGALAVDDQGRVVELLGTRSPHYPEGGPVRRLMFTGIQVLERSVVASMPPAGTIFSVTRDIERGLIAAGDYISSIEYSGYWNDVGTPDRLQLASNDIRRIYPVP